ncbi:MAG: CGGC domain-containing protein [Planctomycetota bacterium]|jgi:predicted metal-binding protein
MVDLKDKDYVAIVQCHIVKERCSGYNCERAFNKRLGGFSAYPGDKAYRTLYLTCGGCCGRAVQRKLSNLTRRIKKQEGIEKDRIVVQLASCLTKDNFHSSPCPHLDYLKSLIVKLGLDVCEDTFIDEKSEKRRKEGLYSAGN